MNNQTVRIKQTKQLTITRKQLNRKKLAILEKKELSIEILIKKAIETKSKCYMLSFDTPNARICKINDIIAELVKNGYLSKMEPTLKNSILFLSPYNLCPINKFIHKHFPDLKFVLVRLNRKTFPTLRYCY